MAHYTALQTAWATSSASTGALPSGVTGTSLFGLSTENKILAINGWTVTGAIPTSTTFTGNQLINCINATEFFALLEAARMEILALCAVQGPLLGGSANTSFLPVGVILKYFNVAGATVAALTALATGLTQPWWQAPVANGGGGLTSPVNANDTTAAGLT